MELLAAKKFCETCGSSVDFDMPSGFCPGCLLNTVLETERETAAGTRIEDYELLSEVARGGMGIVYRARQRAPARIVALKMILPAHVGSLGAVNRFRAEAEAAASLDHESILPIYAVGEHDGAPFYSMKFAEGGTLAARIESYRDKPREAARLVAHLARAVAFAHEHGILHRDLKPGNVLFDSAGKAFVSDFGLAKWLQRNGDLTQTFTVLGTPFYMAPEQAVNSRGVTAFADVFSLGAILYHLLTGHPPFSGDTPMEVLHCAEKESPKPPRLTNRQVPRDLETICLKCLEKEPAVRYESAAALAEDLERFCADRPIVARPIGLTTRAWRWSRRNPVVAGFAASTIALLTVITALAVRRATTDSVAATQSVAVLPFSHPGADQTGELLATGLQDDILVSLSKIAGLKVISRNSVSRYQDAQSDLAEIGRALGVDVVLVGTLRQVGSHARVNVQLTRVTDGTELWAENFDRELNDVFAIQSDLALQIASVLKATVLPPAASGIRRKPTNDSQAYLLYVQAHDLFSAVQQPHAQLMKAEELLQKAIRRDANFALAIALLSSTETILADGHDDDAPERFEKARTLAEDALRLQPELPEAHLAMGRYFARGQGHAMLEKGGTPWVRSEPNLPAALREYETAERGLPGNAEIHSLLGRVQMDMGKWREALANLEQAAALDPNTARHWGLLDEINVWLRRYPEALDAVEHEIWLTPNSWFCEWKRTILLLQWKGDLLPMRQLRDQPVAERSYFLAWLKSRLLLEDYEKAETIVRDNSDLRPEQKSLFLGNIYWQKGDAGRTRENFEAALPSLEQALAQAPLDPERHMDLAEVYAGLHRRQDAIRAGKRAYELRPESTYPLENAKLVQRMVLVYLRLQDTDLALQAIEHSLATPGGVHVGYLRVSPICKQLRNDPRFERLLAKYATRD